MKVLAFSCIILLLALQVSATTFDGNAIFSGHKAKFDVKKGDLITFDKQHVSGITLEIYRINYYVVDIGEKSITFKIAEHYNTGNTVTACKPYTPYCTLLAGKVSKDFTNQWVIFGYLDAVTVKNGVKTAHLRFKDPSFGETHEFLKDNTCKKLEVNGDPRKNINVFLFPGFVSLTKEEKIAFGINIQQNKGMLEYTSEDQFKKDIKAAIDRLWSVDGISQFRNNFNFYYTPYQVPCTLEQVQGKIGWLWKCDELPNHNQMGPNPNHCPQGDALDAFIVFIPNPKNLGRLENKVGYIEGRSGGGYLYAYAVQSGPNVFVHEFGHAAFMLADEYSGDGGYWQTKTYANLYAGTCAKNAPILKEKYGITTCTDFKDVRGRAWSRSSLVDNMNDENILKHSAENKKVIECVVKTARGEKC